MYDIQKAPLIKRLTALILDLILLATLSVGIGSLLQLITGFDGYTERLEEIYRSYEEEYSVNFGISASDYELLSDEEKAVYEAANEALGKDREATEVYNTILNLVLFNASISLFLSHMILEFGVPLLFKNGMTVGKKIFSIAVVRTDCVRIRPVQLFIRAILGKYTFETMVPVLLVIMIYFGTLGSFGVLILGGIGILQIVLLAVTRNNQLIHDLLADTCAVDYQSQKIFASAEEKEEFLKKEEEERESRNPLY